MEEFEKKDRGVFIERQTTTDQTEGLKSPNHAGLPKLAALEGDGIVKSRFDQLSIRQTVWLFKVSAFYCLIAYTSSVMEGFSVNMSGAIIVNEGFINQFGTEPGTGSERLNNNWISSWSAVLNIGQIVCAAYIPWINDRFGRKWAFYVGFTEFLIAQIVLTIATTPEVWLIGKIFVGLGIGTSQLVTTPYVMEISPNSIRGGLATFGIVWQAVGGMLCSVMMQVTNAKFPLNFRIPVYILWGPIGSLLIIYLVLPESPWYYGRRGNKEGAMKSFKRLYGGVPNFDFEEEYGIIERTIQHERQVLLESKNMDWAEVFRGLNLKRLIVMLAICNGTQFAGNPMMSTYSTLFFSYAGLNDPFLASMIQSCVGLGSSIVFMLMVDRVGRRLPMCIAYTIVCALMWVMGGVYYADTPAADTVLLLVVCVYQAFFTVYANTYFLLAAELPTAQLRLKTGAISWITQALSGVMLVFVVPPMLQTLNIRAGFVFGATSLPIAVFIWLRLPETKGRAVAEIDELFERKIPVWRWSKTVTEAEVQMRTAVEAAQARRGSEMTAV